MQCCEWEILFFCQFILLDQFLQAFVKYRLHIFGERCSRDALMRVESVVQLVQGKGTKFLKKNIVLMMIGLQILNLQVLNLSSLELKSFRVLWILHRASCLLYSECRSVLRKNVWYRIGQQDRGIFSNSLHIVDSQWNMSIKYTYYKI